MELEFKADFHSKLEKFVEKTCLHTTKQQNPLHTKCFKINKTMKVAY